LTTIGEEFDLALRDFLARPIDAAALRRAKTRLVADAVYAQDSQATLARWFGAALATGESIEDVQSWPDRIEAVEPAEILSAGKKWLESKRSVTGHLSPAAA
jgi:zinc protease